jgi:hypothetical protein
MSVAAILLLSLFFYPEDRGDVLIRNIWPYMPDGRILQLYGKSEEGNISRRRTETKTWLPRIRPSVSLVGTREQNRVSKALRF